MNSTKKESIGISAIINEVNKFDNIHEELNKREKEPVWDGNLAIYKKDDYKKSESIGRIPVQVKGRESTEPNKKEIFYDIELVDIENYRKDNKGAIFFVVEIFPDRSTKIYYKIFDLKTVEEILTENIKGRKTKRFKLKQLEENELIRICIKFIENLRIYKNIKQLEEVEIYSKKTICYDNNTKYELEEIKKSNEIFYETNAYKEAKEKLEKQNIIILHGEPWVGKTSTARKLVMNYIDKDYLFIYGNVDDLVEIKNKVSIDKKIICLIDDFLGSNVQYLERNIAESTLDKIINIFKNSKDKKLILTTRTYIYNNAKKLFYKFHNATKIKDEYLIDVANYNYMEKGNILYNHMEKNNLIGTDKHIQLVEEEFYTRVIRHSNFNPGVIALICERLKYKDDIDAKKYIEDALEDPEQLWEEEYQKLSIYEKIILTIITLFGVKVPEEYIEEQFKQIIKNEKIQLLDTETFSKSINILSSSFIKTTFNEIQEKQLEVCKHSVADYIISKINKKQIDIERYIKSAKYIEELRYIYIFLGSDKDEKIKEMLACKVENEINEIKDFYYYKNDIVYNILKKNLNKKREELIKTMILEEFYNYRMRLVINILEREDNVFYEYVMKIFKNGIIDTNEIDFLYEIGYVLDCETFFKTCLQLLDYKKDSKFMTENLEYIADILTEIVTEDVEATINELVIESVAEDIIRGRKKEDIIKEHIYGTVTDEIQSLKKLYSKKNYDKLINLLYKYCYVQINEEILEETIKEIKENPLQKYEKIIYDNNNRVEIEQIEYIKQKFENGINIDNKKKTSYYDIFNTDSIKNSPDTWWTKSFINNIINEKYRNIQLYEEFINEKKNVDYSLKMLAEEFLEYILHEKNNISEQSEELLTEIVYESFLKGSFLISKENIQLYKKKYPKNLKELYNSEVMMKNTDGTYLINEYIHLYIAVKELIKRNDNLLKIIENWNEIEEDLKSDNISEMKQEIFEIYSELDTIGFNKLYIIPALSVFIKQIKEGCNKIGKINVSKRILELIQIEIELDCEFELYTTFWKEYIPIWFIQFITGTELQWDISNFEYSIYQKKFYEKCYDEEKKTYILNFNKIMKDKELKEICSKLKIWDYLYDIYIESKKVLDMLKENKKINVHNISKKDIVYKYIIY